MSQLDPEALEQINFYKDHHQNFTGPVRPRHLIVALPRRGPNKVWSDAVALFLLEHIVDCYRVPAGDPWWTGPLYVLNRTALAKEFDTTPDTISAALGWLVKLGLVDRKYSTVTDDLGKTMSKKVCVWPIMAAIDAMLAKAKDGKRPERPTKARKNHHAKAITPKGQASPKRAGNSYPKGQASARQKGRLIPNSLCATAQTTTGQLLSPSALPSVSASPTGGVAPLTPAAANGSPAGPAARFIKAFAYLYPEVFPSSPVPPVNFGKIQAFFKQYDRWTPEKLLLVTVLAWERIGKRIKNPGGTIHNYFACQRSQQPELVIKNLVKILTDINFPPEPEDIAYKLSTLIAAVELHIKIDDEFYGELTDRLQEIFRS